jgi:hypothetical protein
MLWSINLVKSSKKIPVVLLLERERRRMRHKIKIVFREKLHDVKTRN